MPAMSPLHKSAASLRISFLVASVFFMWGGAAWAGPLTVAVSGPPKTLDPLLAADAAAARILQLTHPALVELTPTGEVRGHVATACTQPKPNQVTCTLPQAHTFADGTPLTATAVATWLGIVQSTPRSPLSGGLKDVSITAPTPKTLAFQLPSPTLTFLPFLAQIPIAHFRNPAVGVGPYVAEGPDAMGSVTLRTRTVGLPVALTFLPVADPSTRLLKLKKGEVDIVLNDLSPELVQWARQNGLKVQAVAGSSYTYIGLNLTNSLLSEKTVRQALVLGLNRPAIRRTLLGGLASAAETMLPSSHAAAWAAPEEPYDPFTAETLLDEAGLLRGPDNKRLTLTLQTSTDPLSQKISQAIQAEWAEIGVNVVLRPMEWASFFTSVQKGQFESVLLAWTGEQTPDFYNQVFHSSQVPPVGLNRGYVRDNQLDAMLNALHNATNTAEQTKQAIDVQKKVADLTPLIPLYRRFNVMVTRRDVTSCHISASGDYKGLLSCQVSPLTPKKGGALQ